MASGRRVATTRPTATPPAGLEIRTPPGEWPHYNAETDGSRYSPLDQIDATNFNDLELAWSFKTDNLGGAPEFKLEGTPLMIGGVLYTTAGTRRAAIALDAQTGELIWMYSLREGRRGGLAPRQLSGRGLSYWTDGQGDNLVLYITPGYRLIALRAETGDPIPEFGENGIVDLKVGVAFGRDQQIDLDTGEIGVHSTPLVARDKVIVRSSMREGMTVGTHNNTKGLARASDVRTGGVRQLAGRQPHNRPWPGGPLRYPVSLGHGRHAVQDALCRRYRTESGGRRPRNPKRGGRDGRAARAELPGSRGCRWSSRPTAS